ncbi:uncharacterized protein A4U43_C08F19430 [Asparagus officinalis]|uniref:uncharacterized protein LOC109822702 n=1 Tax=Asparagus officinalis TaxID=4686 RepID=UPI00098DFA65|nr:uncharacterized protein LOC109822702 [Asparagus officinalis]ONK60525.1 uncharacterized protein A4U43_C08F19430 [Asparagus officinalis]
MDNITASEIAGLGVGTILLCATIAAPKVDAFISASQRSALGMCKRCGDLRMVACSQCKGVGSVKKGGPFGFSMMDDLFQSLGDGRDSTSSSPCIKCQSQGRILCPDCSNLP